MGPLWDSRPQPKCLQEVGGPPWTPVARSGNFSAHSGVSKRRQSQRRLDWDGGGERCLLCRAPLHLGLGKVRVFSVRGDCDCGSMNRVNSQPPRPPHGSDSWRRTGVARLHSHSGESKRAIPLLSFLRSVWGRRQRDLTGAGLAGGGARRDSPSLSDSSLGRRARARARGWSREAAPGRPDGLGAVAGGFPGSSGVNFSFAQKPLFLAVTPDRGRTVSPGHNLSTSLRSRWERLHAPSVRPPFPLGGLSVLPREKTARDPWAPEPGKETCQFGKESSVVVAVCLTAS